MSRTETAISNEKSYPKSSNKASNPWWGRRLLEMEKVCNITARLGLPAQNLDNQKKSLTVRDIWRKVGGSSEHWVY